MLSRLNLITVFLNNHKRNIQEKYLLSFSDCVILANMDFHNGKYIVKYREVGKVDYVDLSLVDAIQLTHNMQIQVTKI